jgi:hypothetical protein
LRLAGDTRVSGGIVGSETIFMVFQYFAGRV